LYEAWLEESEEAEDDAFSICIGFLLCQVATFCVMDHLYPVDGVPALELASRGAAMIDPSRATAIVRPEIWQTAAEAAHIASRLRPLRRRRLPQGVDGLQEEAVSK